MGTRYPDRRYRSFLSLAAQRVEVSLPAANRVRFRASRGHERVQGAAGALGQGSDANGEEDSSESAEVRCAVARQSGGVLPLDGEYQLSAHGSAFDDAFAGHD